jgi:hypothetical protein
MVKIAVPTLTEGTYALLGPCPTHGARIDGTFISPSGLELAVSHTFYSPILTGPDNASNFWSLMRDVWAYAVVEKAAIAVITNVNTPFTPFNSYDKTTRQYRVEVEFFR